MVKQFDGLNTDEIELMYKAPILVSILIAGADGNIDKSEIRQAVITAQNQSLKGASELDDFLKDASADFEDKLKILLNAYPVNYENRNEQIINDLSNINSIFTKVDKHFSKSLYNYLKDLARQVAESSGGVLGFKKVGSDEAKLLDLPMINIP
ncbi:MAG TPA: hypothetical protein PKC24_03025 [Cyclobacteriaceae bacterium]|nr:hypothetical protein [Cyclobacteriaceae bacterium]